MAKVDDGQSEHNNRIKKTNSMALAHVLLKEEMAKVSETESNTQIHDMQLFKQKSTYEKYCVKYTPYVPVCTVIPPLIMNDLLNIFSRCQLIGSPITSSTNTSSLMIWRLS